MAEEESAPDWMFAEGEGYVADVEHERHSLRLFSSLSATTGGWAAYVFDLKGKRWLVEREFARDSEDGQRIAARYAEAIIGAPLPPLNWQRTP